VNEQIDVTGFTPRQLWESQPPDANEGVYRLFGSGEVLLYVGRGSVSSRIDFHARTQSWWLDVTRMTVAWYASTAEATSAEALAIATESPVHNGRRDYPLPIEAPHAPGGWIHVISDATAEYRTYRLYDDMRRGGGLHFAIAVKSRDHQLMHLVPAAWYSKAVDALAGEIVESQRAEIERLRRIIADVRSSVDAALRAA
jgi:hypothetical protein